MEPNWQNNYPTQQGTAGSRPSVWSGDGTERAQRPLGTGREPVYRAPNQQTGYQQGYTQGYPGQGTQPWSPTGGQAWQGYPPQPSAAPAPSNPWENGAEDPFEEPPEAPELRDARSDHLYNKEDRFWEQMEGAPSTGRHGKAQPNRKAESHTLRWMVLILAVLVGVGGLVYGMVFRVRDITVQGNTTIDEKSIITLSGVKHGMNTFSIDDDLVERNIESNRYLSFVCVEKHLPDKVIIQVKERVPAAAVKYCGILYTMDNRGMVLEESLDTGAQTGLVSVEGLDIHDCRVGMQLHLNSESQMKVFTEILIELKVMSALNRVKELDLSNMDNLFIETGNGYTVRLGPAENLHAKLRSMLLTMDHLEREGYTDGTLDVSIPVNPTYIPE